jgi:hypothetical protein
MTELPRDICYKTGGEYTSSIEFSLDEAQSRSFRALPEKMWRWAARILGCWQRFGEGAGLKTLSLSRNEASNPKNRCPSGP